MELKEKFEEAQRRVKTLPKTPSTGDLLKLYGYYKQGNEGDVKGKRPGMLDMKGRAKYDAWAEVRGMSQAEAMEAYIKLVDDLLAKAK